MIISKIDNKEAKKELQFPKLMISDDGGQIVLFRKKCCGTVIVTYNNGERNVGEYVTVFAMECFTDFNGSITLSNEV